MSPRKDQDQAEKRKRIAYHMAGHVTVYCFQWGTAPGMSIYQNDGSTPVKCGSLIKLIGQGKDFWRMGGCPENKLAIIAGPLAEAKFNFNNLDAKQLINNYRSDPGSLEAQLPELSEGQLGALINRANSYLQLCYDIKNTKNDKIDKLAKALIECGSLSASEVKQILSSR